MRSAFTFRFDAGDVLSADPTTERTPAGRRQPLPAPAERLTTCRLRVPVPSGLFHAGHVPSDRPYGRAGYVSPRLS